MEFTLNYNNFEETLRLPVNPKGFKISQKNNVKAYNIVEVGDIIQINSESLASLTLDSFFHLSLDHIVVTKIFLILMKQ